MFVHHVYLTLCRRKSEDIYSSYGWKEERVVAATAAAGKGQTSERAHVCDVLATACNICVTAFTLTSLHGCPSGPVCAVTRFEPSIFEAYSRICFGLQQQREGKREEEREKERSRKRCRSVSNANANGRKKHIRRMEASASTILFHSDAHISLSRSLFACILLTLY